MKTCIDTYFAKYYNLPEDIRIKEDLTDQSLFDLLDNKDHYIVAYKEGYASFKNTNKDTILVLGYDDYIKSMAKSKFQKNRPSCDFLIEDKDANAILLNEITSSSNNIEGLKKPIPYRRHKDKIQYQGGKLEKVALQLLSTLQTLNQVPEIKDKLQSYKKKICLCSYKLYLNNNVPQIQSTQIAFNRGIMEIEKQTKGEGIKINNTEIEQFGFEYRRISHSDTFVLN